MLANNLPVERASHAGEVKSEILCDVGGLLFGGRHAGVLVVQGKVGYYVGNLSNASAQRRVPMTKRLLEITSVTAHTECGPTGERSDMPLPLDAAELHKTRNLIEISVHAQLPVENPILEHATFQPGCSLTVACALPRYSRPAQGTSILCLYQHKEWWMRPTWVSCFADVPERTQMLVWKTRRTYKGQVREQWHVLLAVSDRECRADIHGVEGRAGEVAVDVSTNQVGHTAVEGLILLHVQGDDPYVLVERCAHHAARVNHIAMREERPFPQALRGFGWCTWDALGQEVSEAGIIAKMEEFKRLHVPVSWVLIDDGWSQTEDNRLQGFGVDWIQFPEGLDHTVNILKQQYGVEHVGVWQAFQGYWEGVDPASEDWADPESTNPVFEVLSGVILRSFEQLSNGMLIPSPRHNAGYMFWHPWDCWLAEDGIDFVKVDSQSTISVLTRGMESFGALRDRHAVLDQVAAEVFDSALINCMGMAPENYWSRPTSPITRTSDDFFPRIPESLPEHAIENAYCSLLMGCLYHCDWDMFWTKHPNARVHAWLRWFSGGPVYCSDALGETDPETLKPFFDEDGVLTHPDGVGMPVIGSLLSDPVHSTVPLGVRNTFRGEEVLLFVGLNTAAVQSAHIPAGDSACLVRNLETGECTQVGAGETLDVELRYGEYAALAVARS